MLKLLEPLFWFYLGIIVAASEPDKTVETVIGTGVGWVSASVVHWCLQRRKCS